MNITENPTLEPTADELELIAHIEEANRQAQAWMKEAPDRWASMIPTDISYLRERGLSSIAVYQRKNKEDTLWDLYKDVHGIRPRWMNIAGMSDAELDETLQTLFKENEEQMAQEALRCEAEIQKERTLCEQFHCDFATLIAWGVIEADEPWKHLRQAA